MYKLTKLCFGTIVLFGFVSVTTLSSYADSNKNKLDLTVPNNASSISQNDSNHVKYTVNNAVKLKNSKGQSFTAPITVDSQENNDTAGNVQGTSTITADLSQAVPDDSQSLPSLSVGYLFSNLLFGNKVFADNLTKTGSAWDSSLSVKLTTTVYWSTNSNGNSLVTKVMGGYTKSDSSVSIVSSNLQIGCSGDWTNQTKSYSLGSGASWSKSNGTDYSFLYVPNTYAAFASVGGATYSMSLSRGTTSKWSISYQNVAWTKFNCTIPTR